MTEETAPVREPLPPHHPHCFACGPENDRGLRLAVERVGDDAVEAEFVFQPWQVGAPGTSHGGVVATVCDELLGSLWWVVKAPYVTRALTVEYLKPTMLGVPYRLRGQVDKTEGRRVHVSCEGHSPEGVLTFRAEAVFVTVSLEHLVKLAQDAGAEPLNKSGPNAAP